MLRGECRAALDIVREVLKRADYDPEAHGWRCRLAADDIYDEMEGDPEGQKLALHVMMATEHFQIRA